MDGKNKRWEKYQDFLVNGDWHVHTNYVEGENSVMEMCEQAEKNGLKIICFTEHVRKEIDYDFINLVKDVEHARKKFPGLKILVGCEAKILLDGGIDVSEDVLKMCDIVIMSFHGFPPDKSLQISALKKALENPHVDIWGHPATLFRNFDLKRNEIENIVSLCIQNNVLIENSLCPKYLPPRDFTELVEKLKARTVIGSDAHSIWDMRNLLT